MERFVCKKWDCDNYICLKVIKIFKMGFIIGFRIDYDGVVVVYI